MVRTGHIRLSALLVPVLFLVAFVPAVLAQTSEDCLDCHDGYSAGLHGTGHEIGLSPAPSDAKLECTSCHAGAATHMDDPSRDNIGHPARMTPGENAALCGTCHEPHQGIGKFAFDPHVGQDLACTECHSVHTGRRASATETCLSCHVSVGHEFKKLSSHPLPEGDLDCMSCHDFSGQGGPSFGHGGNVLCYSCHPDQSGPFMFEHEATSSFSTEGGNCTSCHRPHGSHNDQLLTQPDDRLCQQCHGIPPLHRTQHEGIGVEFACLDCHVDVHGSHSNQNLLDNRLGSRIGGEPGSCFCHNVLD